MRIGLAAFIALCCLAYIEAGPIPPPAGSPIYNQSTPQPNSQFNVGSGVVRGTESVGALTSTGPITTSGNVTGAAFFGNGAGLTGITATATAAVNATLLGDGQGSTPLRVNPSSVPVLSASGFVQNAQLDPSSVTKQGNTFNAASRLLRLDSGGKIPNDLYAATAALTAGTNTFTAPNTFTATTTFKASVGVTGTLTATNLAGAGAAITAITPANLSAGILPSVVQASSLAYGSAGTIQIATKAVTAARMADGTITNTQISTGSFDRISIPAGNITAGNLPGTVVATAIAASGVSSGTYGSATQAPQINIGADGRITSAANVTIAGVRPGGTAGGVLGGTFPNPTLQSTQTAAITWAGNQTFDSSATVRADLQIGTTHAMIFSASAGVYTMPGLVATPAAAAGRFYYDATSQRLRYSANGTTFVDVATGTIPGGGGSLVTTNTAQTITGAKLFTSTITETSDLIVGGLLYTGNTPVALTNAAGYVLPANLAAGSLPSTVIASSVAAGSVNRDNMITAPGVAFKGAAAQTFTTPQTFDSSATFRATTVPSIWVSSTIFMAGGGIRFPDGSFQNSANSGLVLLTATQTFTGQNTFVANVGISTNLFVTSGRVGIGTSSPLAQLHVVGTDTTTAWQFILQGQAGTNGGYYGVIASTHATVETGLLFSSGAASDGSQILAGIFAQQKNGTPTLTFSHPGSNDILVLKPSLGRVGVASGSEPAYTLDVNGAVSSTAAVVGAGGITFADQTVQTTAFTGGGGANNVSSTTIIAHGATGFGNFTDCVDKSTVTKVFTGTSITVYFAGGLQGTGGFTDTAQLGFLIDGVDYGFGQNITTPNGSGELVDGSFSIPIEGLSPGTHSGCLTYYAANGRSQIQSPFDFGFKHYAMFGISGD